jgi:hypothetical protein
LKLDAFNSELPGLVRADGFKIQIAVVDDDEGFHIYGVRKVHHRIGIVVERRLDDHPVAILMQDFVRSYGCSHHQNVPRFSPNNTTIAAAVRIEPRPRCTGPRPGGAARALAPANN